MKATTSRNKRLLGILGYVVTGFLITGLLVGLKLLLEQTLLGHRMELAAYEFLQGQLTTSDSEIPVVVVDIGDVPGGKAGQVTPRGRLQDLIKAIVEQRPRAVAVDIDFSPNENGWVTDDDPDFFDFCVKTARDKGVPIFLGVFRTKAEGPDTWLGSERYRELAVALVARGEDTSRVPLWVKAEGASETLPSMSYALAKAYRETLPQPPPALSNVVVPNTDFHDGESPHSHEALKTAGDFVYADTLVNYSKLDMLESGALTTISPASVAESRAKFHDKLVIIGDATQYLDPFVVPGRSTPVGGVFLHACATYTLVREPLFELSHSFRLLLDFLISAIIILSVAWIRFRHINTGNFSWHGPQAKFVYSAVAVVLVSGVLMVRWLNVMWLDFFLVMSALLLHPRVECWLGALLERRKGEHQDVCEQSEVHT
jgi:CHASE2 domain-containing sensor protein